MGLVDNTRVNGGDIHPVPVHLHVSDLLVLGVARLLSVGLILVFKDDSLTFVGARVLVHLIAINVSLAIARVGLLNRSRSKIDNRRW